MSYQPVIVGSGLLGWQFLKSTQEKQEVAFNSGAELKRDTEYFEANIANVKTAEDLVSDRRLLRVSLGAFGLQDDIDNKYFIKKILEEGTVADDSLANRMADDRYKSLAKAFSFDSPVGPRTILTKFPNEILTQYRAQEFEVAVGNADESLRMSLNFHRTLPEIGSGSSSNDTKWFRIMGNAPVKKIFETALNLPSNFGQIDLDRQLETLKEKCESRFGTSDVAELSQPEVMEEVVQTYLLQSQVQNFSAFSANNTALTLLQSIPRYSMFS